MKLIELLESYFEGLYHITSNPDLTLDNLTIKGKVRTKHQDWFGKPMFGFWLAKGLSWHNWSTGKRFRETGEDYLYRVKLKPTAKILQIEGGRKVPKEFLLEPVGYKDYIPPKID